MELKDYYPSQTMTNQEMMERIGNGDTIEAIDRCLAEIEKAGWTWEKQANSFGAVIDSKGNSHSLWMAQSFIDAVAMAFRLMQDYRKLGWM